MPILDRTFNKRELLGTFCGTYQAMTKAVVDLETGLLAVDADMHADLEQELLNRGSNQRDLWGINLYPDRTGADFVEFTSFINIRPRDGNTSIEIRDPAIREKILAVVRKWVVDA